MSDIMFVGNNPAKKVRFASEPIYTALCSLCLLSQNHLDSISGWVDATRQHLTDEERRHADRACHATPFIHLDGGSAVAGAIETSVKAFESIQVPGDSVVDQLKFIAERDVIPEEWTSTLEGAREGVYVPSVHIGPFMSLFDYNGTTACIVGRARIPEGSTPRSLIDPICLSGWMR